MCAFGPAYDERVDGPRLHRQMDRIREYMLDHSRRGWWVTLRVISLDLGYPEASVSAQLRHLKKARFGGYGLEKRRCGNAWEYQVLDPLRKGEQIKLFAKASQLGVTL